MSLPELRGMNFNQALAASAFVLASSVSAMAAYGLRYVPMGGDGYGNQVLVWDRWTQDVCQVTFIEQPRYCAKVRPGDK